MQRNTEREFIEIKRLVQQHGARFQKALSGGTLEHEYEKFGESVRKTIAADTLSGKPVEVAPKPQPHIGAEFDRPDHSGLFGPRFAPYTFTLESTNVRNHGRLTLPLENGHYEQKTIEPFLQSEEGDTTEWVLNGYIKATESQFVITYDYLPASSEALTSGRFAINPTLEYSGYMVSLHPTNSHVTVTAETRVELWNANGYPYTNPAHDESNWIFWWRSVCEVPHEPFIHYYSDNLLNPVADIGPFSPQCPVDCSGLLPGTLMRVKQVCNLYIDDAVVFLRLSTPEPRLTDYRVLTGRW